MLREAKIEIFRGHPIATVERAGARITAITTVPGGVFEASVFIDASYEGDLLAKAGVRYVLGRESREEFGESLGGVQAHSPAHQWPGPVPARDERGGPLPTVNAGAAGAPGAGDKKIQAYNFRLCMTQERVNQVPWPKPPSYDPERYRLLGRYLERFPRLTLRQLMNPVGLPNGKTDTNNNGPFSTDHIGANWDYPEADPPAREKIRRDHVEYTQGFYWYLAHDPHVPAALQEEVNRWGLAKDEFNDTEHWPPQLYVREARRLRGEYLMTQSDIMESRRKDDSVGLGSYNTDSHHCQRILDDQGNALNEGDFQVRVQPYAIPYRSLLPKASQCENLLVPVCLSATHVAYGTLRMEPVYMILGHASGVAASLAIDKRSTVQSVSPEALRAKLKAQKAVLSPDELGLGPEPGPGRRLDASKLEGLVVDASQAEKVGEWQTSSATGPFVGPGYLHDNNEEKGKKRVRFPVKPPAAGKYEIRLFYTSHPNRATNVPIVVATAEGEKTVTVNERQALPTGKPLSLGTFTFSGTGGWVELRTEGTDGFVVADAIQILPVK
jgi:hypothetical protein